MKRPTRVKIGPHIYHIFYEKGLATRANASGVCGTDTQEIYIDDDLGPTVERETLLHEIGHAIWTQTNLDQKYSDDEEEAILSALTPRFLELLRSERAQIEWLLEPDVRGRFRPKKDKK